MKKMFIVGVSFCILLCSAGFSHAELTTIGTATYNGSEYNLIWDNDNNGDSVVWLDYTNEASDKASHMAWAAGLDSNLAYNINAAYTVVWDETAWRLPKTVDAPTVFGWDGTNTTGHNITTSEMGHLYYVELGNLAQVSVDGVNPQPGRGFKNAGDFENLRTVANSWYYSSTDSAYDPPGYDYGWLFNMNNGYQNSSYTFSNYWAVAVRSGQVSMTPVPDPTTWYYDNDNDGYGDPDTFTQASSQPSGYVSNNTDCDDYDNTIYPGAEETRGDGIDQDCNGSDLPGLNTYYGDDDNDGYGDPNDSIEDVSLPPGYVTDKTDCDDSDSSINPGATESCNGVDDNCNSTVDEGCTSDLHGAALASPSGVIEDTTPTYTWNHVAGATWYKLFIGDSTDKKIYTHWEDASQVCSDGICSVTPEVELSSGVYNWYVKSWNESDNIWSNGLSVTIQGNENLPSKVTHTSLSGHLETSMSTFSWVADPASTWYKLWVGYSNGTRIFTKWYEAAQICSGGNCTVTTGTEFDGGNYEWYIKSWNEAGKIWSDGSSFSLDYEPFDFTGSWSGTYTNSLIRAHGYSAAGVTFHITQSGNNTYSGIFSTETGASGSGEGTISGYLEGDQLTVTLIQTTPGCHGSHTGTATIQNNNTINVSMEGSDCWGAYSDGTATVQKE